MSGDTPLTTRFKITMEIPTPYSFVLEIKMHVRLQTVNPLSFLRHSVELEVVIALYT